MAAELATRRLCDIESREVTWLWKGRIPMGKVTMLCGDPGLGKSFLTLDIAARVTRPLAWPDAPPTVVGSVLVLSAEDDAADTILPRLRAAGGDPARVVVCDGLKLRGSRRLDPVCLNEDIASIEKTLTRMDQPRLVIIDPISAYMGDTDSNNNAEVRAVLAELARMAAQHDVAVLCVTHLNKNGTGKATYRLMGSLAFAAAARVVWQVGKLPGDERLRLMALVKANLETTRTALSFSVEEGRVKWASQLEMDADELEVEGVETVPEAQQFLIAVLRDGPRRASEILAEAASAGLEEKAIRRAKKRLGITAQRVREGATGYWVWALPTEGGKS